MPTRSSARIDFRLTTRAKATIEKAAALSGQSLSDFAVATLLEKAQQILEAGRVRSLSESDARAFLKLLDAQEQPNAALQKAAAWYKENYGAPMEN